MKSLRGRQFCLLVFRLMLNMDIHSDKATTPCQGDLKYWFGFKLWHKETGTFWAFVHLFPVLFYKNFEFSQMMPLFYRSLKPLPPPVWQQELSGKLLRTLPIFCRHVLAHPSLLSVWTWSSACDWLTPPENGASSSSQLRFSARIIFKGARHYSHRALIHILSFTDPLGLGGHK